MMKPNTLILATVVLATALAGCTGGGGGSDGPSAKSGCVGEECGDITLSAGKGAVSGLLIDDRYRPVAEAAVLLLPLGLDTVTNENGEFGFVDLEPGTYTIKVSKEKHEAAPARVDVAAGQFTEAIVEARRTVSDDSVILTQEYAIFIPCSASAYAPDGPGASTTAGYCSGASGDTYRPGIKELDYTELGDITYLVAELKANREGNHIFVVRHDDGSTFGGEEYAEANTYGGDYARIQLQLGEAQEGGAPWNNDKLLAILMFPGGTAGPLETPNNTGVEFGTRGQVVVSLFIGEPDVDINTYAVLA